MRDPFTLAIDRSGVARLVFDQPDAKVNTFSSSVMAAFSSQLDALAGSGEVRALVLSSAKPGIFIAGADIGELAAIEDAGEAESKSRQGQAIFNKISALPFPSIALIDGACVGGGLECALACSYRVVTDNPKTKLGLPEVSLGIIPGWGGTQRLPILVGLPAALDLILSGRLIDSGKAVKIGLADLLVSHAFIEASIAPFVEEVLSGQRRPHSRRGFSDLLLNRTFIGRALVFRKARQSLELRTKGHYPAPEMALEVVRSTFGKSFEKGLIAEARAFAGLCGTDVSKNLIQLYYTKEALKKDAGSGETVSPALVRSAAVLGAGVMGGGIAWLFSSKDIPVRMKDISWDAIAHGLREASDYYRQLEKRRKLSKREIGLKMHRIGVGTDYAGFKNADLVVEAVVENLNTKRAVLSEVESWIRDDAVLATNTSSLTLVDLAQNLRHPQRFVGMHFFNPVNRMPLVEVVAGPRSSPEAVASVIALAKRLGKTPIQVNDCAGFLVNRILIPYLNESAYLLQEGASMVEIDRVIEAFGMPMGPFVLADEVGLDVGLKVAQSLEGSYGARMRVAELLRRMYEERRLVGKKQGRGFYLHEGKRRTPNDAAVSAVTGELQQGLKRNAELLDERQILERALLPMINEAARCLEENIVASPEYLDMAMILGTGFPPFRGGPLRYADKLGATALCRVLDRLQQEHGPRFEPAPLLLEMERKGSRFYA